ncbi:hypothetical protein [Neglectibacter timonensis]|uniref:hypothetical protein n=2 Tax=Neglectibacter timonensis TaxID=1776382 RepID=UPI002109916F|nr:hypothetical protein [Neglectibacter timonensis]
MEPLAERPEVPDMNILPAAFQTQNIRQWADRPAVRPEAEVGPVPARYREAGYRNSSVSFFPEFSVT